MERYLDYLESPMGWIGLLGSPNGLRRTTLPRSSPVESLWLLGSEAQGASPQAEPFRAVKEQLSAYLSGAPVAFDDERLDVDDAPPFLRAAWSACRSIPFGETRTYSWLASRAGSARAFRAAGQAMARNRLPIIIPCHRVIASDGTLGGFGMGGSQTDLKRRLIEMEATGGS